MRGVALGAGYFAPYHYEAWTRIPEAEIVAMFNPTEDRAASIMTRFGVSRYYSDWKEMIDREAPDFVDVITPPDTHEEICRYAAERGVHIICQKPLAPTFEISRRIVEFARAAGVRFMVHENFRWQPWYREIKRIQTEGLIGDFTHLLFSMRTRDGWGDEAYLARQPFFRDKAATDVDYPRANVNFAGDCVYFLQRHFVDCMLSGREFESNGDDYLQTIEVVEAAYESARLGQVIRLGQHHA